MTDAPAVPPEFVSYVERRLPQLEGAALRLTGQESQADRLSREMLSLVALKWQRFSKDDTKSELTPGSTADVYLSKLFQQEAEELSSPQIELHLNGPAGDRRYVGAYPRMALADEAELIWLRSRKLVRRRWILAGSALAVAGVIALCRPRGSAAPEDTTAEVTTPTRLPANTDVLPTSLTNQRAAGRLPAQLTLPAGEQKLLSASPVNRAIALLAGVQSDTSPIFVLGDDGGWRKVDAAPQAAALWIHPGSLAPDGVHAVFGTNESTTVVDLRTGSAKLYPPARPSNRPVWLTPAHLLLGPNQLLDLATGVLGQVPVGPENVLIPQDPPGNTKDPLSQLFRLLSVGDPVTAPARIQRFTGSPPVPVTKQLDGAIAELVGQWREQGFLSGDGLAVRACQLATRPSGKIQNSLAIIVTRTDTGELARAILSERAGSLQVLGWLDDKHVLFSLVSTRDQTVISWDITSGQCAVASVVNTNGVLSLPDLTSVL